MSKLELTGQKFNRWTVLEYAGVDKHQKTIWKCQCSCENKTIAIVNGSGLTSGKSRSCVYCAKRRSGEVRRNDLSGETINNIQVLKYIGRKNNTIQYLCKCKCGRSFTRNQYWITHGENDSCGKCELLSIKNPELLEEWDYEKNKNIDLNDITFASHKRVWWSCRKCGHSWEAVVKNRTINETGCPKCNESKGNKKVSKILTEFNIKFEREIRFYECRDKNPLIFDFYLPEYNICIEYQGWQHYMPVKQWGGQKGFESIQKRDQIKRDYCQKNGIKLIEIHYNDLKNVKNIVLGKIL